MNAAQVDRAVMARRAAKRPARVNNQPISRNPGARPSTALPGGTGSVRRSSAVKMTGAQRRGDGSGKRSDWSASPTYWTDPKWGHTVSTEVGGVRRG